MTVIDSARDERFQMPVAISGAAGESLGWWGVDSTSRRLLTGMTEPSPEPTPDALDDLVAHLLGCGAVLSQIISHMVMTDAAGGTAPDAAPIPAVAHGLIRDAVTDVTRRYSARQITATGAMLGEMTDAICENIYLVPTDLN
ncbi:MAG: hypothetical protein ABI323_07565 [Solirubrobacteraceae bacterium]